MAKTPEGEVKDRVRALFKKYRAYYHSPVQNGMGKPGLDFHCCVNGLAFFVEAKAPGKHPTPRQQLTMRDMLAAGAKVFVVGEHLAPHPYTYSGMEELEDFLKSAMTITIAYS